MAQDEREHLLAIIAGFQVAMLTTRTESGDMHGRPMLIASLEGDGELVLCTRLDSAKIEEIEADSSCAVLLQGKTRWVSLTGHAHIDRDRQRIHALWREVWRTWFPGGKNDPEIALVVVRPSEGEYWDESGARGLRFIVKAAGAILRRRPMAPAEPDQHGKVEL